MTITDQLKCIDNSHGFLLDNDLEAICKSKFTGDDNYEGFWSIFTDLSWDVNEILEENIYSLVEDAIGSYEY